MTAAVVLLIRQALSLLFRTLNCSGAIKKLYKQSLSRLAQNSHGLMVSIGYYIGRWDNADKCVNGYDIDHVQHSSASAICKDDLLCLLDRTNVNPSIDSHQT
jgi:hypothetical protein